MVKPVSKSVLLRERRQLRRRVAALIVGGMANTDLDFHAMQKRCGRKAAVIRKLLHALIDGYEVPSEIDFISDICLSMGYEPTLNGVPLSEFAMERK